MAFLALLCIPNNMRSVSSRTAFDRYGNSYNVTAILTKVKSRGLRNVGRHPAAVKMVHRKLILGRSNPLPFDRFAALVQLRNVPVRIDGGQPP